MEEGGARAWRKQGIVKKVEMRKENRDGEEKVCVHVLFNLSSTNDFTQGHDLYRVHYHR